MLCAFPAGVVECQCPRFTVAALEKMDACPPDTRASDSPPSSCSSISMEIKKRQRKKGMLDLSMLEDREAQTKEAIWSVRNQIPFWDVFNTLPPPHQKHQTSKKMFFWSFFTAKWCTKKKKTFAGKKSDLQTLRPSLWMRHISPVNTLPASIFTWLTPFTGQGMNKSHLVYSLGSLTKKRRSTWRRTAVFSCHRCPRGTVKNYGR